MNQIPMN